MAGTLIGVWTGTGWDISGATPATFELLSVARALQGDTTLVAIGPGSGEFVASLEHHGLATVIAVDDETDSHLEILELVASLHRPDTLVLPADALGRELGPRLAARAGGTAITNVVALTHGDPVTWSREVFGGNAIAEVAARRVPTVVTVQSHAFRLAEALEGVDPPSVTAIDVPASNSGAVRVVSAYDPERVPIKLEAAPVIVAGGRGIGDADLFASLSELADLLGGAVAATGAAIDEGWALTEQKIGLTGSVVSPELYVAVGVSGASQHLVGFSSARRIVAINTDRSAPIFKIADIGAVIDAGEAIPGLIALLKERSDAIDPAIDR